MNKLLGGLLQKAGVVVAMSAPVAAFAQAGGPDYSPITTALVVGGLVTAIVAAAAVKASPNVAKWGANKIANFFR